MPPAKPDHRSLKSKAGEWLLAQGLGAVMGCGLLYAAYQLVPELIREQRDSNNRNVDKIVEAFKDDQVRDEQRYNRLFDQAFPGDKPSPVVSTPPEFDCDP